MYYEEKVVNGVLCSRTSPGGDWVPMTAEVLTAKLLEARQQQKTQVYGPAPAPSFVVMPAPVVAPKPGPYGWEVTC